MPVPKDGDADGLQVAMRRLGAPESADGYDFHVPADIGEGAYSEDSARWFRDVAHQASLTKAQARTLHDAYVGEMVRAEQEAAAAADRAEAAFDTKLRREWG